MPKERNIRVTGKRREFEVGRFVLAVMVHAEALAEADTAGDENKPAAASTPTTDTIWERQDEPMTKTIKKPSNTQDDEPSERKAA